MTKEVTRHEFLRLVGVALLSLIGITGILGALTSKDGADKAATGGFGRGYFGR